MYIQYVGFNVAGSSRIYNDAVLRQILRPVMPKIS